MPTETADRLTLMIGHSPETAQVRRRVEKLGRSRWPVLVLGETGTGKEVAARSIHQAGPRGPFVTIDCTSMVGTLMESELFGHLKGAFTNADHNKIGLVELANGGTAFFDEIGELPLDVQAKLLRVIQEKEFRPVGSTLSKRSDFRVIAATNRDLAREVERGTFRGDLYYRLNVTSIRLKPLRERRDDIPVLVEHFLTGHGRTLTQEVMDLMMEYPWPGNVRELENCIHQLVANNSGPLLHVGDLPSALQNFRLARRGQAVAAVAGGSGAPPAPMLDSSPEILPLAQVERREILRAMAYTKGDRVMAATLLGIGRTTLYRKLKEYGLVC